MKLPGTFLLLLLAIMPDAIGCPVCDTETGQAVRDGIFNESFLRTFLEVASPFPVLALLLYFLNRYLPD